VNNRWNIGSFFESSQEKKFLFNFFRSFTLQICKLLADLQGKTKLCTYNEKQKRKEIIP